MMDSAEMSDLDNRSDGDSIEIPLNARLQMETSSAMWSLELTPQRQCMHQNASMLSSSLSSSSSSSSGDSWPRFAMGSSAEVTSMSWGWTSVEMDDEEGEDNQWVVIISYLLQQTEHSYSSRSDFCLLFLCFSFFFLSWSVLFIYLLIFFLFWFGFFFAFFLLRINLIFYTSPFLRYVLCPFPSLDYLFWSSSHCWVTLQCLICHNVITHAIFWLEDLDEVYGEESLTTCDSFTSFWHTAITSWRTVTWPGLAPKTSGIHWPCIPTHLSELFD